MRYLVVVNAFAASPLGIKEQEREMRFAEALNKRLDLLVAEHRCVFSSPYARDHARELQLPLRAFGLESPSSIEWKDLLEVMAASISLDALVVAVNAEECNTLLGHCRERWQMLPPMPDLGVGEAVVLGIETGNLFHVVP